MTSSESIDLKKLSIFTGRYDSDDGIYLGIDGEPFPRVFISTLGDIKTGDGTAPPSPFVNPSGTLDSEAVRDTMAVTLVEGNGIDIAVNDPGDTITLSVVGLTSADIDQFNEVVQDLVAEELGQGNNVSLSYNDASGLLTISVDALDNVEITNSLITSLSAPLSVANGGTGASTAALARTGLEVPSTEDERLIDAPFLAEFQAWRRALAALPFDAANIMFVGDSITEGFYSALDANTWVQKLNVVLQRLVGFSTAALSGGEGFVPSHHTTSTPAMEARWTLSGGVTQTVNPLYGLGLRSSVMHAGDTATLVFTGTRLDILYTQQSGAGTIRVAIDGGANQSAVANVTPTKSGRILQSAAVADGVHTAVVTITGNDVVFEGGLVHRGTELVGIRVWQGGHSGYSAQTFADPTRLWDDVADTVPFDLVVVELGFNDYNNGRTPTQLQADMEAIVDRVRAKSAASPSFLFLETWMRNDVSAAVWRPYTEAIRRAARSRGAAVFSLWELMGIADGSTYWQDTTHPSAGGQITLAQGLARYLTGTDPLAPMPHAARHRSNGADPFVFFALKTADQSKFSDTTLADDTELTIPGLLANKNYHVTAAIHYDADAATDLKTAFGYSGGATNVAIILMYPDPALANGAAALTPTLLGALGLGTPFAIGGRGVSVNTVIMYEGTFRSTGAGTLRFQWAQNASNAIGTRVRAGSFIRVEEI